jgi:microcin C transport system substrate-binding protein
VPNFHISADRILWWNRFSRPDTPMDRGANIDRWWYDADKAAALSDAKD